MAEEKFTDMMYKPNMGIAFTISLILFFLYMILQLIELNTFIKSMDILDVTKTTRGTLVYTYLLGYFVFIFKLFLQLFTIVIIVTLIFWIIIGVFHIFTSVNQSGGYTSAAAMRGGEAENLTKKLQNAVIKVFANVMGIILLKNFFIIFFVVIPLIILFFTLIFSQFYDRDIIIEKDEANATRITLTNHNFMIMLITIISVFCVLILAMDYYFSLINRSDSSIEKMEPDSSSE
jgi:hypothetical protein